MGRIGGKKKYEKYGSEGMSEMSKKGNEAIRKKYTGTEFFKERSKKGVEARLKKRALLKKRSQSALHNLADVLTGE